MSVQTERKLLEKHNVTKAEVFEAFRNRTIGRYLTDTRSEHQTVPASMWFISRTSTGRHLKIVFIAYVEDDLLVIKSAYDPSEAETRIWLEN
jgi:hypothetical protein